MLVSAILMAAIPRARADELPREACAIRIPFSLFENAVQESLSSVLQNGGLGGATITDVTTTPVLGGLDYEQVTWEPQPGEPSVSTWVPTRLSPPGSNNPDTSNDDYLDIDVTLTRSGFDAHIHVALAIPELRPIIEDATTGRDCEYGTMQEERTLYTTLQPCPEEPPEELTEDHEEWEYYNEHFCTVEDGVSIDLGSYPSTNRQYCHQDNPQDNLRCLANASVNQYYYDQTYPPTVQGEQCDRMELHACEYYSQDQRREWYLYGDVSNNGCVVCVIEQWTPHPVHFDPGRWPQLLAVDFWWDASRFVTGLAGEDINDSLKENGYFTTIRDGHYYSAACRLQQVLNDSSVQALFGDVQLDDEHTYNLAQLYQDSGGVRISDPNHSIKLLIPPVRVLAGVDDQLRESDGEPECRNVPPANVGPYDDLGGEALAISLARNMDFPKVLSHYLKYFPKTRQYYAQGVGVECNHAPASQPSFVPGMPWQCDDGSVDLNQDGFCSCWENSRVDTDGDGFCDDEDYCPTTFTGANCDIDGDGHGDGPRYMVEHCLVTPSSDQGPPYGYGEAERAARQFHCGGCDNCPGTYNPWRHTQAHSDFMDVTLQSIEWPWVSVQLQDDNGELNPERVALLPSRQLDRDSDTVGDACDRDADSDGVDRRYDVDDLNPAVGEDADGDRRADVAGSDYACSRACEDNGDWYGSFYNVDGCLERCQTEDNCREPADGTICSGARDCQAAEAANSPDDCPSPECTFVSGPNWPRSSDGNRCIPAHDWCSRVFANRHQEDADEDGIGDKCDWANAATPELRRAGGFLFGADYSGSSQGYGYRYYPGGTVYDVSFRPWGGSAAVSGGQRQFTPETRTNTQVGACACNLTLPDGTWDSECLRKACPKHSDNSPLDRVPAWNPINSPECAAMPFNGDSADEQYYNDQGVCYNRSLDFTRDEETNFQTLSWRWKRMRALFTTSMWSAGDVIGFLFDRDWFSSGPNTTAVRVAWPNMGEPIQLDPDVYDGNLEAAFTRNVGLHVLDLRDLSVHPAPGLPGSVRPIAVAPSLRRDPLGPVSRSGYLLAPAEEPESLVLFALDRGTPDPALVYNATFSEGIDTSAQLAGAAGSVNPALVGGQGQAETGIFVYQAPASPALLYVGQEDESLDTVHFATSEDIWGQAAPEAFDPLLVFVPDRQELILLGSQYEGGPRDRIWRMRLSDGAWEGPVSPRALWGLRGYSAAYDPIGRAVLLVGGHRLTPCTDTLTHPCEQAFEREETSTVLALDPMYLKVQPLGLAEDAPAEVARSDGGATVDVTGRALYVVGGTRDGAVLSDTWRLDLRLLRWSRVDPGGPAMVQPFVTFDRGRQTLWAVDVASVDITQGLSLWGRMRQGTWQRTTALRSAPGAAWPASDVYVQGRPSVFLYRVDESQPLLGRHILATLSTPEPRLGLALGPLDGLGQDATVSELRDSGDQVAGLLCPSGEQCLLRVDLLEGAGRVGMLPFELDVQPAVPVLERFAHPGGFIQDLALRNGKLIVALGPWGLKVLDPSDLTETDRLQGPGIGGASALASCGSKLCVARRGVHGLSVVQVGASQGASVVAAHQTEAGALDIAVSGATVYLAHGTRGVGVYRLPSPASLTQVDLFHPDADGSAPDPGCPGGHGSSGHHGAGPGRSSKVVSVALLGNSLLAVAERRGRVYLYDVSSARNLVSEINLPGSGRVEQVRFHGRKLWVLARPPERVVVYDVSDPHAPQLVGEAGAGSAEELHARYAGARRYSFGANLVSSYRLEPVTP